MNKTDFVLVGVGGQGILLASDVLATVGLQSGYDVKKSEVHGMAQRGGSVMSHIRWARLVRSPLIGEGEADYLVAFEKLEALRFLSFVRPGGIVIANDYSIPPVSVTTGVDAYPDDETLLLALGNGSGRHHLIPAMRVAEELGNLRTSNVVMLGALSALMDLPLDIWHQAVSKHVPQKYVGLNLQAFKMGRALMLPGQQPLTAP